MTSFILPPFAERRSLVLSELIFLNEVKAKSRSEGGKNVLLAPLHSALALTKGLFIFSRVFALLYCALLSRLTGVELAPLLHPQVHNGNHTTLY